jgi:sugar lactone lactonase YvrE
MRLFRGLFSSRIAARALPAVVLLLSSTYVRGQWIVTVAGGGPGRIPGTATSLARPVALAVGAAGDLFIADSGAEHDSILRLDESGLISRIAGYAAVDCTAQGSLGNGGPARRACVDHPDGVTVDAAGNVYLAESSRNIIRRVDALSGLVTTVAGNGTAGYGGDGGLATAAALNAPAGVAADAAGNLFIADRGNHRIRRVDAATGFITTAAGDGTRTGSIDGEGGNPIDDLGDGGPAASCSLWSPGNVFVDGNGGLFISDAGNSRIRRVSAGIIMTLAGDGTHAYSGENVPATSATLAGPAQVAVDGTGNVYFGDFDASAGGNNRVRRIDAVSGLITTVAGGAVGGFSGDGGQATDARLHSPSGIAVDAAGNLIIADRDNARIRRVTLSTGVIATVAGGGDGSGYDGTEATLHKPEGVYFEENPDRLFIPEPASYVVRRLDLATGIITTLAGDGIAHSTGDGGPATEAGINYPTSAALDESGNLVIGESFGHRVRRVDGATGIITTVAGTGAASCGPDGVLATTSAVSNPSWALPDVAGNLFIADFACQRIRRVDAATGIITTFAGNGIAGFSGDGGPATSASLNGPSGLALDASENLFVAEYNNSRVRRIDAVTHVITTVAGGGAGGDGVPATSSNLKAPVALAIDAAGDLFIGDVRSHSVRRVDATTQIITTVAGGAQLGYTGDGGLAAGARLYQPYGVAVDDVGNLFIADTGNNRVRSVRLTPPQSGLVPDGSLVSDRPLLLTSMANGDIGLSWGPSCSSNDTDFEVYEGALGDFTSHVSRFCSTGGALAKTFTPSPGNTYYLVVSRNAAREGSYGQSSDGSERPPAISACLPQASGGCH